MLLAICGFGALLVVIYLVSPLISPKKIALAGKHVLVTGGSSGIGKAIAAEVIKRGASVTLLARSLGPLQEAKELLEKKFIDKETQKVLCISVDLASDYDAVENAVKEAQSQLGPVDMLVNSAGCSTSAKFEDIPLPDFQKLMNINYMGSVYATRAVLPTMKAQGAGGRLVFLSSQAGQLGLYGFTAYSASKFALRGLAESLQMEVKPYGIRVTLAFPPDTDTPGFHHEQIGKPKETKLISETAGLFQPEYVAKVIVDDAVAGKFQSHMGLDGYMLSNLTSGMSPITTVAEAAQQVVTMGVFRAVSLIYLDTFDRIVKRCKKERDEREDIKKDN